jgi:ubiquitin-protein ligase
VLRKQLKGTTPALNSNFAVDLGQNDEIGCSVGLEDDNNFFKWNVVFEGPTETIYEVRIG